MTTLEKVGSRLYFVNSPFASKDAIKRLGGHWDGDRRQWWIGAAKRAAAEKLVTELNGTTPQFAGATATPASAKVAESVGLSADTPAGIVADRVEEGGDAKKAADLRKPVEDLSAARVYAKVEYKGHTYYVIARTMTQATATEAPKPLRVRLATLREDGPVFWADAQQCRLIKEYHGRKVWDGLRYSNRTVTTYTTLGSIRSFVAEQRRGERDGTPQCAACGKRSDSLVHDLEDGCMKCRGCADMPEGG